MSRYFDVGRVKNLSLSLTGYHDRSYDTRDYGMYLSLSMPWDSGGMVSYNTTTNHNDSTHRVGYNKRIDEHNNYQLTAGSSRSGANMSGYYNHENDAARLSANANYQEGRYSALGMSAQGGMTLTPEGGSLHRVSGMGGTRLLVDTNGVAGVPIRGYGSSSSTNRFGKAVVADVNSYYRNKASIDLNKLGDNAEATRSVVQATLTEGAIGYRKFDVIAGEKAMAVITLPDNNTPPFGATVMNRRQQETGIVNDGGSAYLSGINAGETMTVHWSGTAQCQVQFPAVLPTDMLMKTLSLPCRPIRSTSLK